MTIRKYADCYVEECNTCGEELETHEVIFTQELEHEHYCDTCRPGCADCGADLTNTARFAAPDITPDGQPMWWRCEGCHDKCWLVSDVVDEANEICRKARA